MQIEANLLHKLKSHDTHSHDPPWLEHGKNRHYFPFNIL
jgi:hypothetical protein